MIVGIGADVVSVPRFSAVARAHAGAPRPPVHGRERVTDDGHPRTDTSLAGRFAAKEAVAKALGAPLGHALARLRGRRRARDGRPWLRLTGTVAAAADALGIDRWHLSLTHDGDVAVAYVVAEKPMTLRPATAALRVETVRGARGDGDGRPARRARSCSGPRPPSPYRPGRCCATSSVGSAGRASSCSSGAATTAATRCSPVRVSPVAARGSTPCSSPTGTTRRVPRPCSARADDCTAPTTSSPRPSSSRPPTWWSTASSASAVAGRCASRRRRSRRWRARPTRRSSPSTCRAASTPTRVPSPTPTAS